jgi:anti-sigma B factor antagonist
VTQFEQHIAEDGTCVVRAGGEVDLAVADEFQQLALGGLADAPALEVDLAGVTFMDSTGFSVLVRLRKEATAAGKPLWLAAVPPVVERLLAITGTAEMFERRGTDIA